MTGEVTEVRLLASAVKRSMCPTLLDGLTDADWTYGVAGGVFTVTIDADLDAATVCAVRDRLLTVDDAQESERAAIRALVASDPSPLARALARNWLGDE